MTAHVLESDSKTAVLPITTPNILPHAAELDMGIIVSGSFLSSIVYVFLYEGYHKSPKFEKINCKLQVNNRCSTGSPKLKKKKLDSSFETNLNQHYETLALWKLKDTNKIAHLHLSDASSYVILSETCFWLSGRTHQPVYVGLSNFCYVVLQPISASVLVVCTCKLDMFFLYVELTENVIPPTSAMIICSVFAPI